MSAGTFFPRPGDSVEVLNQKIARAVSSRMGVFGVTEIPLAYVDGEAPDMEQAAADPALGNLEAWTSITNNSGSPLNVAVLRVSPVTLILSSVTLTIPANVTIEGFFTRVSYAGADVGADGSLLLNNLIALTPAHPVPVLGTPIVTVTPLTTTAATLSVIIPIRPVSGDLPPLSVTVRDGVNDPRSSLIGKDANGNPAVVETRIVTGLTAGTSTEFSYTAAYNFAGFEGLQSNAVVVELDF